jgi:hypothetical protein
LVYAPRWYGVQNIAGLRNLKVKTLFATKTPKPEGVEAMKVD